jgi:diguanylate cyclase (GGDEF)-like protein
VVYQRMGTDRAPHADERHRGAAARRTAGRLAQTLRCGHNRGSGSGMDSHPGVHSSATGMAASDPHPRTNGLSPPVADRLTAGALHERLEEEIDRAERERTRLSCLLVVIENLDEMAREHGSELREQTLAYVAAALARELRRYDRIGPGAGDCDRLLIILPGTDSARGEIVARRALQRLRAIKLEAGGTRRALHVSVGLAAWREQDTAESLLASARAALQSVNGEEAQHAPERAATPGGPPTAREATHASADGP